MIAARSFSGKNVALFGLGGSGLATAEALAKGGAAISAWDDNPQKIAEAEAAGIQTVDLHGADFSDFDAMVLSPGVPLTHPKPHWTVELARAASIPIIGDIEIFSRELDKSKCPFIAITGTNGKSTTTALISHIIRQSGRDSQMGGNIGRAVLTLDPPEPGRYYIVECSSYQIDLAPSLSPDIGILLNVTPDHLDRHGTMENYTALKERLVARSTRAIVGVDDANTRIIAARLLDAGAKLVRISKDRKLDDGYFADGARLKCARSGEIMEIADISAVGSLRGAHNAQNALAAWAACEAVGLTHDEIRSGLATFPGLAHRMEQVGRIGNTVLFINDSKATNADAAAPALSSFANIRWIAGGLQKQGGFDALKPYFKNITKAYLIGEAAPALAAALGDSVPFEISVTLEAAVVHATADARNENSSESVVLLSPACASFDQFRNFEKRGEAFRSAVLELDGIEAIGGTIL